MHQIRLEYQRRKGLHLAARYALAFPSLFLIGHSCAATAAGNSGAIPDKTRPSAHLHCSLKVGERSLLEGQCRVTALKDSRMLVEDEGETGITLIAVPEDERDRIFWNEGNRGRLPKKLLGVGQWLDNCWRSISSEDKYFYLCLINKEISGRESK